MLLARELWPLVALKSLVHPAVNVIATLLYRSIWLHLILDKVLEDATQILRVLVNLKFIGLGLVSGGVLVAQVGRVTVLHV